MRKIIFGIRQSKLAQAQLDEFISYLNKRELKVDYMVKKIKTKGDKNTSTPIEELGQGIFIKELENQLISGNIDCAVHSLKDMPINIAQETTLSCFLPRSDERDCIVYRNNASSSDSKNLRIGTGSPRRQAFIKEQQPDAKTLPLRGNIDTRLKKLDQGEYDAIILASCGLKRIGHAHRISEYFDSSAFVPAGGQGTICAQTRGNDEEISSCFKKVSCKDTEIAVTSERKVLKALGIGCRMPFGVFARFEDNAFIIVAKAFIEKNNTIIYCKQEAPKADYERVTNELIKQMKLKMSNGR